ncbi:MAG: MBL fold metallo-hydrolase, partial [Gemmatimonadota bacterium]|nr:MBL fold metallo-hydrolase [Gemmatimonadota bacterium]
MFFRQVFEPKLAQYSYIVGCQRTGEALVIDPMRDIDRYEAIAAEEELRITAVTETHIHADFLSGAREYAARGVQVYLSDEGDADWKYRWVQDDYDVTLVKGGDSFQIGNIKIEVVHTPGHTPEHIAFMIIDEGGGASEPMGIASGDFVFVGDLGRPDLLESAAGVAGAMEPSARRLFHSATQFLELPDYLQVWPGHGAGSACGKALGAVPESTVGYERRFSPALDFVQRGEDAFVEFILEGQPEPPMYFARMKKWNKEGAPILGRIPSPAELDETGLDAAVADGAVVLDTRVDRSEFMSSHLPGSLYAPLDKTLPTIAGSYIEPDEPIVLVANAEEVEEAVLDLVRIGLDGVVGYVTPTTLARMDRLVSTPVAGADDLERLRSEEGSLPLDVRRRTEYDPAHVPGALNVAHTRLRVRKDE